MRKTIPSVRARALPPAIAIFAMLMAFSGPADAQRRERAGKEVVDAVCAECHNAGKDNAPRIADARAWMPRASQGLSGLTATAISGIRKMPAHGGSSGVSDVEIQRAITYMVNRSGGTWVEPLATGVTIPVRTTEVVVEQCAACHRDGKDGAPKIGDRNAWTPRLAKGLDVLVASAVHGHGPMPSRGGMPDLSNDEIRHAVLYMFNYGIPPMTPAPPVQAAADPFHKVVAGTDIYFGMIRAEAVQGVRAPRGKGYYHLNVSLADAKSQSPLTDASVTLVVSDGMSTQTKPLEKVVANKSVSYGNFFRFDSGGAYNITARIQRPNAPAPIEAKFEYRAP